jgi:CheY-like chemotaxis protein
MNEYFDMILLDVFMPDMDGYSTAKKIRAFTDSKKANIPIIVITASNSDEISKSINESGINDFIIKPFQPEELIDKISKYLP